MNPAHKGSRCVYHNALPLELCQELLFIQRSLAVVGYRPHVQSLTLYELLLACPQLLPVVAKARQLIWNAVEEQFDSPCQVWPETTSLISWTAGASIGWHHDANQPYLAARHFSAVAYLNTQGRDFEGGTFCFQSGTAPLQVQPAAGMLLVYTADDSNVHSVQEVTAGERSTMTMWFTLDPEHQEDRKVLSKLQSHSSAGLPSTMHVLGDSGHDIRVARLQQRLGVTVVHLPSQQQCQQPHIAQDAEVQRTGVDADSSPAAAQPAGKSGIVVQCCAHPRVSCCSPHVFASLQEAVMACCMLEWRCMSTVDACGSTHARLKCEACALLPGLPAVRGQLCQYLDKQQAVFEHLLPRWRGLDALVTSE